MSVLSTTWVEVDETSKITEESPQENVMLSHKLKIDTILESNSDLWVIVDICNRYWRDLPTFVLWILEASQQKVQNWVRINDLASDLENHFIEDDEKLKKIDSGKEIKELKTKPKSWRLPKVFR